jgi:hypothetical protein
MLHIVLWKWAGHNRHFTGEHVNVMCAMLRRNLTNMPHRIVCVTDNAGDVAQCETAPLWTDFADIPNGSGRHLPSCYRRLKLYDPATQRDLGIDKGDRIMSIDLDALIAGDIRKLVQTPGEFVGWELKGSHHARVFNGSLQMFDARKLDHIWKDFDPGSSILKAAHAGFKGSDQAWLSYNLINREGSVGLKWPDVSSWPLQNRVQGILRRDNRIIFFHGNLKPWDAAAIKATPWIPRYWHL